MDGLFHTQGQQADASCAHAGLRRAANCTPQQRLQQQNASTDMARTTGAAQAAYKPNNNWDKPKHSWNCTANPVQCSHGGPRHAARHLCKARAALRARHVTERCANGGHAGCQAPVIEAEVAHCKVRTKTRVGLTVSIEKAGSGGPVKPGPVVEADVAHCGWDREQQPGRVGENQASGHGLVRIKQAATGWRLSVPVAGVRPRMSGRALPTAGSVL